MSPPSSNSCAVAEPRLESCLVEPRLVSCLEIGRAAAGAGDGAGATPGAAATPPPLGAQTAPLLGPFIG